MTFYRGFSTIDSTNKWTKTDVEIVKRDILNHFNTHPGERADPTFGSQIWNLHFEGMSVELREAILADAQKIIDFDPRVVARSIAITEYEHGFQIEMDLYFTNVDVSDSMFVQFNSNSGTMTNV